MLRGLINPLGLPAWEPRPRPRARHPPHAAPPGDRRRASTEQRSCCRQQIMSPWEVDSRVAAAAAAARWRVWSRSWTFCPLEGAGENAGRPFSSFGVAPRIPPAWHPRLASQRLPTPCLSVAHLSGSSRVRSLLRGFPLVVVSPLAVEGI